VVVLTSVANPDRGSGAFLNPESGMVNTKSRSRSGIRDEHSGSYFRELKFFDADPNPGSGIFLTLDPGWKIFESRILNTGLNF
jgi:hypothetical protein